MLAQTLKSIYFSKASTEGGGSAKKQTLISWPMSREQSQTVHNLESATRHLEKNPGRLNNFLGQFFFVGRHNG